MKTKIALITLLTDDISRLAAFYRDILGFSPSLELDGYVEFANEGVRFAICRRSVLKAATSHRSYDEALTGQAFELAFPLENPAAVDTAYAHIIKQGATPVKAPADMPWGQRAAFFADPDGNIHELFADLAGAQTALAPEASDCNRLTD